MPIRVLHVLNQFFGGLGGEEQAGAAPTMVTEARGPGRMIATLAPEFEIIGTVIVGDNWAAERGLDGVRAIVELVQRSIDASDIARPDVVLAGPAFNAGRYGLTCGGVGRALEETLGVPVVSGMSPENPGADSFRPYLTIAETAGDVTGMREALERMIRLARKRVAGEPIVPALDHALPSGRRVNVLAEQRAAHRAIDMLLAKIAGKPFETEYPMPVFDRVAPAPPVDPARATVALVTTGGIVPRGNPDHIESASATRFGEYDISGVDALTTETHRTVHGGYDPTFADADPNRVVPVDAIRRLERDGRVGRLHERYFATVGNATSIERAREFGRNIAERLLEAGVQAVILTSTWGTCTRCGATLTKELERVGLPTAHVCSIVPISKTVGANRIVPSVAIPHPLGDPSLSHEDELAVRTRIVERAIEAIGSDVDTQTVFAPPND